MLNKDRFIFSQSSFQDFLDCPRRFELKYVQRLKWPAQQFDEEEDFRHFLYLGSQFHKLIHQYFLGISPSLIQSQIFDQELSEWWMNFLNIGIDYQPSLCFPETTLGGIVAGKKIIAKYDLIISQDNRILIYDWKTSRKRPGQKYLQNRVQTRLYQFLMVESGKTLLPRSHVAAEEIEMVYWFSNEPDNPIMINYSNEQFNDDRKYLGDLINNIWQIKPGDFQLTNKQKNCAYCVYRSLCDRGQKSGQWNVDAEILTDEHIDSLLVNFENELEQISETWV